jgi:hypothetical protein
VTYVEFLRVRGILKWTAIVLLAFVALLVVARISFLRVGSGSALSFVHGIESEKDSRTTNVTLPDGTKRTIVDNPKSGVHIVADYRGYSGTHIVIRETGSHRMKPSSMAMGDIHVETEPAGKATVTTIDTSRPEDLAYYAGIATFVALVVGTLLGAPFARENDGHLELALTKPKSRTMLALQTFGTDVGGIVAAWILTVVFLFVGHSIFEVPNFFYGPNDTAVILLGLVGTLAWYAMLCAATASMKRAYGIVLGMAWPVALLVMWLGKIQGSTQPVLQTLHAVAVPFSWIDPFTYLHFGPAVTVNGQPAGSLAVSPYSELPMLAILALVYGAVAVFQWRRVEA